MSRRLFTDLFSFEENDRDKKLLKKDFRAIEKDHKKVKFKHLIGKAYQSLSLDYYLTSSEDFGHALKAVDAQRVLDSIAMPISDSDGEDGASNDESFKEIPNFNEKLMHVICLNQAIDKYEKELEVLKATKEAVLADL